MEVLNLSTDQPKMSDAIYMDLSNDRKTENIRTFSIVARVNSFVENLIPCTCAQATSLHVVITYYFVI